MPGSNRWYLGVGLAAVLLLGLLTGLILRPDPNGLEARLASNAKSMGNDGAAYLESMHLLDKASRTPKSISTEEWNRLKTLMSHGNHEVAQVAYGTLPDMAKTQWKEDVYRIVEDLRNDGRESFRKQYIHFAGVTRKPGWREEAAAALNDPDPVVRDCAKAVLEGVKD